MLNNYFMSRYRKRWMIRLMKMSIFLLISIAFIAMGKVENSKQNNPKIIKTIEELDKSQASGEPIEIVADDFFDLKVTMEEDSGREDTRTKGHYVAVSLSDKLAIIYLSEKEYNDLLKNDKAPYIFKGKTYKFKDEDLKFFKDYLVKNGGDESQINTLLSANYLNGQDSTSELYYLIAMLPLIPMFAIFLPEIRADLRGYKSLKKYSKRKFKAVLKNIDEELSSNDVFKQEFVCITKNYIVIDDKKVFFVLPIDQLMWVYEALKQIGNPYIIPCINTFNFVFSDAKKYTVILGRNVINAEDTINAVVNYIASNHPRTLISYKEDMAVLLKKNPNKFVKLWQQRVSELENKNEA